MKPQTVTFGYLESPSYISDISDISDLFCQGDYTVLAAEPKTKGEATLTSTLQNLNFDLHKMGYI